MRILLVKLGALGDLVFALPAAAAIKAALPAAHLTWAVGRSFAPLLAGHPDLDRVVSIDDRRFFSARRWERVRAVLALRRQLAGAYDLILVAHRARAYSIMLRALVRGSIYQLARDARETTGWRGALRTGVVVPPLALHESLAIRRLVEEALSASLGRPVAAGRWAWDSSYITDQPPDLPGSFVAMQVGGGQNPANAFLVKRWPHVAGLVGRLLDETDQHIVLVGGAADAAAARQLVEPILAGRAAGGASRLHDCTGRTSVRSLVGLLRRARLFVGADSGPLHVADSLGIKCVGLYGATSPVSWGLLRDGSPVLSSGAACSPCYRDDGRFPACPHDVMCMAELGVDRVFGAVRELLPAASA